MEEVRNKLLKFSTKVLLLERKVELLEKENLKLSEIIKNDIYLKNDLDSARRLCKLMKSNL